MMNIQSSYPVGNRVLYSATLALNLAACVGDVSGGDEFQHSYSVTILRDAVSLCLTSAPGDVRTTCFAGDGAGKFGARVDSTPPSGVGWNGYRWFNPDVDADGKADLCGVWPGDRYLSYGCWKGDGAGGFSTKIDGAPLSRGIVLDAVANWMGHTAQFADFNGDGKADLCLTSAPGDVRTTCFAGDGAGKFGARVDSTPPSGVGWNGYRWFNPDVDADGKADLCGVWPGDRYLSYGCWKGDGAGGFSTKIDGAPLSRGTILDDKVNWTQYGVQFSHTSCGFGEGPSL